jgi:hypothetical protein
MTSLHPEDECPFSSSKVPTIKHFPALAIQQPPFVYKQDEGQGWAIIIRLTDHFAIHNKSIHFIVLKCSENLLFFPSIQPQPLSRSPLTRHQLADGNEKSTNKFENLQEICCFVHIFFNLTSIFLDNCRHISSKLISRTRNKSQQYPEQEIYLTIKSGVPAQWLQSSESTIITSSTFPFALI